MIDPTETLKNGQQQGNDSYDLIAQGLNEKIRVEHGRHAEAESALEEDESCSSNALLKPGLFQIKCFNK